jgi:hypothetical protein
MRHQAYKSDLNSPTEKTWRYSKFLIIETPIEKVEKE